MLMAATSRDSIASRRLNTYRSLRAESDFTDSGNTFDAAAPHSLLKVIEKNL
jgi:hypothetical protein